MEQSARRRPRHRPLETCGGVILSMARVVYTINQTLEKKNLSSSILQKLFEFVIFFVSLTSPFHRHFLAVLSVADDHILALQDATETYFPSSSFVFVKIFGLLTIVETLPEKFDGFLMKLPSLMNRVVWLDWLLVFVISWLGLLVNLLGRWRDKNKGTKEKEITVDRSFSRSGSISQEEEKENLGIGGKKRRTRRHCREEVAEKMAVEALVAVAAAAVIPFWNCLRPDGFRIPSKEVVEALIRSLSRVRIPTLPDHFQLLFLTVTQRRISTNH